MITDINQLDFTKQYTYADYLTWQFKERVELLRGFISKMSAPSRKHQEVNGKIYLFLGNYLLEKSCKVYHPPFDVRLTRQAHNNSIKTVVQPDICVVCDASKLDDDGCLGAPELIAEVLSKSTSRKDLNEKKVLYEENGVQEYWVVHPEEATITQFLLLDGKYQFNGMYTEGDFLESVVLKGFRLDLTQVFKDI